MKHPPQKTQPTQKKPRPNQTKPNKKIKKEEGKSKDKEEKEAEKKGWCAFSAFLLGGGVGVDKSQVNSNPLLFYHDELLNNAPSVLSSRDLEECQEKEVELGHTVPL